MKPRIAIIGGGLCGSILSTRLRDRFHVTLIEQGRRNRPIVDDIACSGGEINSTINRAEGLGGTTRYWHNALIELASDDLRKAGIGSGSLEPYYSNAWQLFLSPEELRACHRIRDANRECVEKADASLAHMVLPRSRANLWRLANTRWPGADIAVVYGKAQQIVTGAGGAAGHVVVETRGGVSHVEADCFVLCAGGLATPQLLARSIGENAAVCTGYHDHSMAYVAKLHVRRDSVLKQISCTIAGTTEVRAGVVFEFDGVKTALYLRPATGLGLRSIQGEARYVLSDLRNQPWSPRKIAKLLANPEAVREAVLFKTKSGFRGDYYSMLIMGEQLSDPARALTLEPAATPTLDWRVTERERSAYRASVARFLDTFAADIQQVREIPASQWAFRTAAHHSGAAARFLSDPGETSLEFFSVKNLPGSFVCDGSLLRATGIANSGLTLVALSFRLSELISLLGASGHDGMHREVVQAPGAAGREAFELERIGT